MKKILAVFLMIVMLSTLFSACGGGDDSSESSSVSTASDKGHTSSGTSVPSVPSASQNSSAAVPSVPSDSQSSSPAASSVPSPSQNSSSVVPSSPSEKESSKVEPQKSLSEYLAGMSNYTVTVLTDIDGEPFGEEVYLYDNGVMLFSYEDFFENQYNEYVKFNSDGTTDYYSDYLGTEYDCYFVVNSKNECYIQFDYTTYSGLGALKAKDFTATAENRFSYTGANINKVAKEMLYDEDDAEYGTSEVFKTMVVTVSDKGIVSIALTSDYNDSESVYKVEYRLEFTDIGSTEKITLPEKAVRVTDDNYDELFGDLGESSESGGDDYIVFSGLPKTGDAKALVIPVAFTNYSFTEQNLKDLQIAFNGTAEQTGWQSVSSFYQISSGNKLNLSFDITDVYTVKMTSRQFGDQFVDYYYNGTTDVEPIDALLDDILQAYDSKYDFSQYDINGDGVIDAVYLIYAAPVVYESTGKESDDLWWSWQTYSYSEETFDDVYPGYYVWSGIGGIYEAVISDEYGNAVVSLPINANTLIHETAHLLDLEDYYDSDPEIGPAGGLGGGDMMDSNVGDHCAFSKIELGWIKPTIVSSSVKITIGGLTDTGNCIAICKDDSGVAGEYILIDLYLPTGLNAPVAGYLGLPEEACVRIYHVNATMGSYTDDWGYEVYGYLCNNSTTEFKMIKLLEADGDNSIESTEYYYEGEYAAESDYYHTGDALPESYTWQDGSAFGFTVRVVSVDAKTGEAVIQISFN